MACENNRKRDSMESMIQGNPKLLLASSPFFSGLSADKLPISSGRTGYGEDAPFKARLQLTIRQGTISATGLSRTRKEAERLCAIDACQQLNALGLLQPPARQGPEPIDVNPKNHLVKSVPFRNICCGNDSSKLPIIIHREGPQHKPTFKAELPIPLQGGKVWTAMARGRSKSEAERACCLIAVGKLRDEGLLNAGGGAIGNAAQAEKLNETPPIVNLRDADLARIEEVLHHARAEFLEGKQAMIADSRKEAVLHGYSEEGVAKGVRYKEKLEKAGKNQVERRDKNLKDDRKRKREDDHGCAGHEKIMEQPRETIHPIQLSFAEYERTIDARAASSLHPHRQEPRSGSREDSVDCWSERNKISIKEKGKELADGRETLEERERSQLGNGIEQPSSNEHRNFMKTEDDEQMQEQAERRKQHPEFAQQRACRQKLPAWKYKQQVLDAVAQSQVVVLTGETGCGKTTQVPQFLLEDAEEKGKGSRTHIVITQPRRIAAISVAERVAWERGEPLGQSVGYAIRLENRAPRPYGSLLFCTTGILLRRLQRPDGIERVSHIIIDEVHERDVDTDFLLVVVRELLQHRSQLRVVIMSATLDASVFTRYFGWCPLVSIPGFTYPVDVYHMEDFQVLMGATCPQAVRGARCPRPWSTDEEEIDVALTAAVIAWVCLHYARDDGALLCFLPGWDSIQKVQKELLQMGPASRNLLFVPLHSQLPSGEQRAAFSRPPPGMRKVVLSTNIAETSVTIDDVVYVVDCGRSKEKSYEPAKDLATMRVQWVSQASARQRQGRAGRVRAGHCFRLYTREIHATMKPHVVPEMQRVPLEELCLSIKSIATQGLATGINGHSQEDCNRHGAASSLGMGDIATFLSKALQPPAMAAIRSAIQTLQQIGALDEDENMTALGWTLGKLAVHPRLGKMLVYGALLGCLQPLLTIAAASCSRDPFLAPVAKRGEADRARLNFAQLSAVGSDQLTVARAFDAWERANMGALGASFCETNFLSQSTLRLIAGTRQQLERTLLQLGLSEPSISRDGEHAARVARSVMVAGLYPNVARSKVLLEWKGKQRKLRLGFMVQGSQVTIHPNSVVGQKRLDQNGSYFLAFHEKVQTSQVFVRSCTLLPHLAVALFGGSLGIAAEHAPASVGFPGDWVILAIDQDLRFVVDRRAAGLLLKFRRVLDKVLARWVSGQPRTSAQREVVNCAVHLLDSACQDAIAG